MRFLIVLALLMMLPSPVNAQEQEQKQFYIKKKVQTNIEENQQPAIEQQALPDDDPLAILRGEQAPVEPEVTIDESQPVGPQLANIYYQNCVKGEHPNFTPEGKEMLCACTAAKMQEELTEDELRKMAENSPEGQAARDKVTIFVYAPCIQYPTRDLVWTQCIKDPTLAKDLKHHGDVCSCLADGMAEYTDKNAQKVIMMRLRRDPGNTDPLGDLVNSYTFNKHAEQLTQICVQERELGMKVR